MNAEHVRELEEAYRQASAAFHARVPVIDGKRVALRGAKAAYRRLVEADRRCFDAQMAYRAEQAAQGVGE
jgi:hypothetical protein